MDLLVSEIVERFNSFLWPMIRISAFLLAAPFFSIRAVSVRIRILLAFLLTWMIYPMSDWQSLDPLTAEGLKAVFVQVFGSAEPAEQVFEVLESWGTDWFQREAEVDDFERDCVIQFSGTCSFSAQSTSA